MITPSDQIIDPRELRIGNYLLYDGKIVHVTMLSLDIDDEYQEIISFCEAGKTSDEKGDWNRALADKLSRIPIRPEILIACGFKLVKREMSDHFQFNVSTTTQYWELSDSDFIITFEVWITTNTKDDTVAINCKHKAPLRYLHELQNVYFITQGNELEVDLLEWVQNFSPDLDLNMLIDPNRSR